MFTRSPEDYGKLASSMKPDRQQDFKGNAKKIHEGECQALLKKLSVRENQVTEKKMQSENELAQRGNWSSVMTQESFIRGVYMAILLIISSVGEFVITCWTLTYCGMGKLATIFVALAIQITSLETVNIYLTYKRKRDPQAEDKIFLRLGTISFLLVILLYCFSSEVRQSLIQATTMLSASDSPADILRTSQNFYNNTNASFKLLMILMSIALLNVTGIYYHDVKNRILIAMSFRKLHRGIHAAQAELLSISVQRAEIEEQMESFDARFEYGLIKAQAEKEAAAQNVSSQPDVRQDTPRKGHNINWQDIGDKMETFLTGPIIIMIIACIIFFVFRGSARGEASETIILLDTTISTATTDYSGKETEFQKNQAGIEKYLEKDISPGERIKILGITESSFSRPYLLLEGQITLNKGAFSEGVARDKLRLIQAWKKLNVKPEAQMSDIFGAISLASNLFPAKGTKELILFSDMRQYGQGVDLETPKIINADAALKEVLAKGSIPLLDGVRVWCLGVHSAGKTPDYWISLRAFWTAYFRRSKAVEPIIFSMERRVL